MSRDTRLIEVDDFEHRVLMRVLADKRNDYITEQKPTDDVNNLILKVIDAPHKKRKDRVHDER